MSDQLALLSFYLGLTTILITVFFVRLDNWHGEALALERQWQRVGRGKRLVDLNASLLDDIQTKAYGVEGSCPWRGFALVVGFLLVLGLLTLALGSTICPADAPFSIVWFIYFPGLLFSVLFIGGAISFMLHGVKLAKTVLEESKL